MSASPGAGKTTRIPPALIDAGPVILLQPGSFGISATRCNSFFSYTGRTHFLGMTFGDLNRLQIDIETYCQSFNFPSAARENDRITAIALSDSTGWERLISGKEYGEAEMLHELVQEIQRRDPDVIEGHNVFRFDLEYIEARARRHKVALTWAATAPLRGHASRMQIAERTITYRKYVLGRHIVDTWILAQLYDVATRELENYGLKDVARHFGVAGAEGTYVPPDKTSWYFDQDPDTLFRYALEDVRETRAIAEILSPSYFVQAQIFPSATRTAAARQCDQGRRPVPARVSAPAPCRALP